MKRALCIPYAPVLGDARRNKAQVLDLARRIAEAGENPDVVILPELALSGYVLESLVAEAAQTEAEMLEFAGELTQTGLNAKTEWVIGVPLREASEVYNAAVVLGGGKVIHIHKKLFLPTYGMFDEGRYFKRGSAFTSYTGVLGKTTILICEDAWHMELGYAAAESGAENVVVISSSPGRGYFAGEAAFDSTLTWRNRLQVLAESYGQRYIYCNRSGVEDGILYDGSSFALVEAGFTEPESSAAFEKAKLFEFPDATERHIGFGGASSRQNDLPLMRGLLGSL